MPHPSSPHHRPRPDRQEGVQVTAKTLNWKSGDTSSSAALLLSVWLWASHLNLAGLHFFSCKIEFGADIWFPWFLSVLRMMSLWFQLWVYGSMSRVLLYWQWFKELLRKTRQGTPSKVWDGQGQTTRPSPVQSEAVHGPGPEPLTDWHISSHRSHCSEMLFRGTADSWSAFSSSSVTCEAKSEVLSYHGALFKGNNPLKKGDVCVGGVGIRWEEHSVSLQGSWVQTGWKFRSAEDGSGVRVKAAVNTGQEQPGARGQQCQGRRCWPRTLNPTGMGRSARTGLAWLFTKEKNRALGSFKKHKSGSHHICQQVEGLGAPDGGRGLDCRLGSRGLVEATCWSLSPSPLPPRVSLSLTSSLWMSLLLFLSVL